MSTMKPFINRKVMAFLRLEGENGVAETTPLSADSHIVLRDIMPDMNLDKIEQLVSNGRYGELQALIGKLPVGFKASHDVQIALAAGPSAVLPCDRFLRALGQKPAATSGKQAYTPHADEDIGQTITIWIVYPNPDSDEIVIGIRGFKGGGSYRFATGKALTLEVEGQGVLFHCGPWSGTFPSYEADPAAIRAPVLLSGAFTCDDVERSISEGTLQLGHTLVDVDDASQEGGIGYFHVSDRKPTCQLKVRADINNGDEQFLYKLQTPGALASLVLQFQTISTLLSTTPYTMTLYLNIPMLDVRKISRDDIGGDLAWGVDGVPIEDSGNDQFELGVLYATA